MPQSIVNPQTGERRVLRNGQWVAEGQAAPPAQQGPIYTGVDPAQTARERTQNLAEDRFQYQQGRDEIEDRRVAEEDRRREAELAQEARSANEAQEDAVLQLDRMLGRIDQIETDVADSWFTPGVGETGASGAAFRSVPGTAAYGLARDISTLDANQVLQAMTRLKELSPTGSTGFGALSAPELELLRSSIASLDPNSDHETFMRNLREARDVYTQMRQRLLEPSAPPPTSSSAGQTSFGRARRDAPESTPSGRGGFGRAAPSAPPADISDIMRRYRVE